MKDNPVRDQSYAFALQVIRLYRELTGRREYVLSRQMARSGTSIGANVEEALAGQSRRDFAAKMAIASKEARECRYWLRLLRDSGMVSNAKIDPLIDQIDSLSRVLTSIVKSAQEHPAP